ncbi:MAG: FIG00829281: hypothetical protein, partial [uncultured Blastococcus sp.]
GHRGDRLRGRLLRPHLRPVPLAQGRARLRPVRPGRRQRGPGRHRGILPRGHGAGFRAGQALPRVPGPAPGHRTGRPGDAV